MTFLALLKNSKLKTCYHGQFTRKINMSENTARVGLLYDVMSISISFNSGLNLAFMNKGVRCWYRGLLSSPWGALK